MPPFDVAARLCLAAGHSMEWLATGREPETPEKPVENSDFHGVRPEDISLAVQLAQEALDGDTLEPDGYGQLVALIHGALVNGLPRAQVVAFARPAARGISRGKRNEGPAVGGAGEGAAGAG